MKEPPTQSSSRQLGVDDLTMRVPRRCALPVLLWKITITLRNRQPLPFILDAEYLVDPTGFIAYLRDKVAVGNVCTVYIAT
jgi:hypothetical protein